MEGLISIIVGSQGRAKEVIQVVTHLKRMYLIMKTFMIIDWIITRKEKNTYGEFKR